MFPFPTETSSRGSVALFISKLYEIFVDNNGSSPYYEMTADNVLVIKNPELFASEIVPRYFKHSSYRSFEKQLFLYDFVKADMPSKLGFSHESFKQGRADLLSNIKRKVKSIKKAETEAPSFSIANAQQYLLPAAASSYSTSPITMASLQAESHSRNMPQQVPQSRIFKALSLETVAPRHSLEDIVSAQAKLLKAELVTIGLSVQRKLTEQEGEISELRKQVQQLRKSADGSTKSSHHQTKAVPPMDYSRASDDRLKSFADLISVYAQPMQGVVNNQFRVAMPSGDASRAQKRSIESTLGLYDNLYSAKIPKGAAVPEEVGAI